MVNSKATARTLATETCKPIPLPPNEGGEREIDSRTPARKSRKPIRPPPEGGGGQIHSMTPVRDSRRPSLPPPDESEGGKVHREVQQESQETQALHHEMKVYTSKLLATESRKPTPPPPNEAEGEGGRIHSAEFWNTKLIEGEEVKNSDNGKCKS